MTITIKQRVVTNAIIARLGASGEAVGDMYAPNPAPQRYFVVEPLQPYTDGGVMLSDHSLWLEYRIRCVGTDPGLVTGRAGPRMDAEALADIARAILSDLTVKIEGATWRVTERRLVAGSVDAEGPTVNVIDDWSMLVCPR